MQEFIRRTVGGDGWAQAAGRLDPVEAGTRMRRVRRRIRQDPGLRHLLRLIRKERGVGRRQLLATRRGIADVALARQLGMYLMNVTLSRSYTDIGMLFGRDRTTVTHACARIEDLRDDPDFDAEVDRLERALLDRAGPECRHAH